MTKRETTDTECVHRRACDGKVNYFGVSHTGLTGLMHGLAGVLRALRWNERDALCD